MNVDSAVDQYINSSSRVHSYRFFLGKHRHERWQRSWSIHK